MLHTLPVRIQVQGSGSEVLYKADDSKDILMSVGIFSLRIDLRQDNHDDDFGHLHPLLPVRL
jgi:hypothetical protein